MAFDVGKPELHGLDLDVHTVCGVEGIIGETRVLQDAEGDERSESLPVGRNLVQREVAEVLRQWIDPVTAMAAQVIEPQ